MEQALRAYTSEHRKRLGMVSLDIPLISNLSVLQNIALIKEYHSRWSRKEAEALVLAYLEKLRLTKIAGKRNPTLTDEERFCTMVLRAVMVEENHVVIDRPFMMMPGFNDSRFIRDTLDAVDDLLHNGCVFDYIWNQDRYAKGRS